MEPQVDLLTLKRLSLDSFPVGKLASCFFFFLFLVKLIVGCEIDLYRLLVGLPDAQSRTQILSVILKNKALSNDIDLDSIASKTKGYSGKDLQVKYNSFYRLIVDRQYTHIFSSRERRISVVLLPNAQ